MCSTKKPPAIRQAPAVEPAKAVNTSGSPDASAYNREQALKRGMASVWTRYSAQGPQSQSSAAMADKSTTLGGT